MNTHRRFLVVVRCGDSSFHPSWISAEPTNRNWDIHLSYFGSNPHRYGPDCLVDSVSYEKGPKYHGLFEYIESHKDTIREYEYIALPDDDLQFTDGNWSSVFDIVSHAGASLAQPSLDRRSFFAHDLALRRRRFIYREVDFVEVMSPVFRVDFLFEMYEHFKLNQSSWGLDFLWSKIAKDSHRKMVIVDSSCFLHTRRVGQGGQYGGRAMESLYNELDATVAKYSVDIWDGRAYSAWTDAGKSSEPIALINRHEILPRVYKLAKKLMGINVVAV